MIKGMCCIWCVWRESGRVEGLGKMHLSRSRSIRLMVDLASCPPFHSEFLG